MIITKNVLIYKKSIFSYFFSLLKTGKKIMGKVNKYLELFTDHNCTIVYKDVVKEICKPA